MSASRIALCTALALGGCGGPQPATERGRELFAATTFSSSPSNVFSCATCHDVDASAASARRSPGYLLSDTVSRPSWWGGSYDVLLDAVNECMVGFLRGRRLTRDDEDGRALLAYLESISPAASAPALPLTVVNDIVALPAGDAGKGAATWRVACERCHGAPHTGAGRLAAFVSILPESTVATFGSDAKTGARPVTIEKVRHGKFFNIGGVMPLYSVEALPDAELADLLSYLGLEP